MIPDKDTRDIQAYLRGTLPRVRREKFELRLQNDINFKTKFDELSPILDALKDIHDEDKIKKIIEEAPPRGMTILYKRVWQYAAAVCLLILGGVFWHDSTMDSRLSKGVSEPIGVSQGASIDECPDQSILQLYYNGNYQSLIDKLKEKEQNPCVSFYEGMAYLGLEDVPKAIPLLSSGTKSTDIEIKQYAEWYLSNAYINTHEKEKARAILKQIAESSDQHRFRRAASELLIELDKKPILFNFQF